MSNHARASSSAETSETLAIRYDDKKHTAAEEPSVVALNTLTQFLTGCTANRPSVRECTVVDRVVAGVRSTTFTVTFRKPEPIVVQPEHSRGLRDVFDDIGRNSNLKMNIDFGPHQGRDQSLEEWKAEMRGKSAAQWLEENGFVDSG